MSVSPQITSFFDEATNTASYLITDPETGLAAMVDPVLDFDFASGRIETKSADAILAVAKEQGAIVKWVLETHVHADHLSAAAYLKARTGANVAIGSGVRDVAATFAPRFGGDDAVWGARDFDRLLEEGDEIQIGALSVAVMATPGHTPACVSYRVGDVLFVGDTLFMPDYGTARTDFPGGDARQLYRSIRQILSLPRETRLFLCHDYKAPGRSEFAWQTSVGEQIDHNVHIGGGVTEEAFVAMRRARDATLGTPRLLYPSLQVNIRAGRLPEADGSGERHLKIPLEVPKEATNLLA